MTALIDARSPLPVAAYPAEPAIRAYDQARTARAWLAIGLATAGLVADAVVAGAHPTPTDPGTATPLLWLLALAQVAVVPGLPIVALLRIASRPLAWLLTVVLSCSITTLVAMTRLVSHSWAPIDTTAFINLAAIAVGLISIGLATASGVSLPASIIRSLPLRSVDWTRTARRVPAFLALGGALYAFDRQAHALDLNATGNVGIADQLGPWFVVGAVLLGLVLVATLSMRRIDTVTALAAVATLVVFATMLLSVASDHPDVPTAYVHRAFAETIAYDGTLYGFYDARYNWAGFFALIATASRLAGTVDADALLLPAPLFFAGLTTVAVFVIARALVGSHRVAWVAAVLYLLFTWYKQDYFAPQALALLMYATVLAVLLTQARRSPVPALSPGWRRALLERPRRTIGLMPGWSSARVLALEAVLVVCLASLVITHQLTPMMVVVALVLFPLTGTTRYRFLWLFAAVGFVLWFAFGAEPFWIGHLRGILDEFGDAAGSLEAGVGRRLEVEPTYQRMQYVRIASSLGFALVAVLGWLGLARRARRSRGVGHTWLVGGLLCAAPVVLVGAQSYGGEMIIRVLVFASPVLAAYAAVAVTTALTRASRWTLVEFTSRSHPFAFGVRTLAITAGFLAFLSVLEVNRGLNAAFETTSHRGLTAAREIIEHAPPGVTLMTWGHAPELQGYRSITNAQPRLAEPWSMACLDALVVCTLSEQASYVYITQVGIAMLGLQHNRDRAWLDARISELRRGDVFLVDYDDGETMLLRRRDQPRLFTEIPGR